MDQMKIIIESLLTGSQFEVAINEHDKVLIVKSNIQKILGETLAIRKIKTDNKKELAGILVSGQLVSLRPLLRWLLWKMFPWIVRFQK